MTRVMVATTALAVLVVGATVFAADRAGTKAPEAKGEAKMQTTTGIEKVEKTDAEWKKALTPQEFHVLREEGTERAFTGKFWDDHDEKAVYVCAGCGLELFRSGEKFDSGTGWPSFWAPAAKRHVAEHSDMGLGMLRTEVECARCGGHLGHLFDDGPEPTGMRYCINSAALTFEGTKRK